MDDTIDEVREALSDRFRVKREIGHGGMATVYLANELNPPRPVAIKVFEAFLSDAVGRKRFLREIELVSRLNHPHIVPIYAAGEAEGILYFVMPFVEGETVRARLSRRGAFSVRDALHIAHDVAGALAYAHEQGVIHRDIKPENILLARRHALVADFGIAKAATRSGLETLTRTGFSMGTPRYMSPEQARGESIDGRSDIYGLGRVLYEMLFEMVPPDPSSLGPDDRARLATLAPEVAAVVEKSIAPDPAARFGTAEEFADALRDVRRDREPKPAVVVGRERWAGWFLAGLVVVAALVFFVLTRVSAPTLPQVTPRLVVLPFETVGVGDDRYYAEGLDDEIARRLAGLDELTMISMSSARHYADGQHTVARLRDELGADYAMEGTVRSDTTEDGAGWLAVSVDLFGTADGAMIWSGRFGGPLVDVFSLQSAIADSVAASLDLTMRESQGLSSAGPPTQHLDAYGLYVRGNALLSSTDLRDLDEAARLFSEAVAIDTGFALGFASLGRAHVRLFAFQGDPRPVRLAMADSAVQRATQLDRRLTEIYLARGDLQFFGYRDYKTALRAYASALERQPNNGDILGAVGNAQRSIGRWTQATSSLEKAWRANPRSGVGAYEVALAYLWQRDFPKADEWLRLSVQQPSPPAHALLMRAWLELVSAGDTAALRERLIEGQFYASAAAVLADVHSAYIAWRLTPWLSDQAVEVLRATPSEASRKTVTPFYQLFRAEYARRQGDESGQRTHFEDAVVILQRAAAIAPNDPSIHSILGHVYVMLGRFEEGIDAAARAVSMESMQDDAMLGGLWVGNLMRVYARAGMADEAVEQLEVLLDRPSLVTRRLVGIDPELESLRSDPRVRSLVESRP